MRADIATRTGSTPPFSGARARPAGTPRRLRPARGERVQRFPYRDESLSGQRADLAGGSAAPPSRGANHARRAPDLARHRDHPPPNLRMCPSISSISSSRLTGIVASLRPFIVGHLPLATVPNSPGEAGPRWWWWVKLSIRERSVKRSSRRVGARSPRLVQANHEPVKTLSMSAQR
jgi:hypothetical protein